MRRVAPKGAPSFWTSADTQRFRAGLEKPVAPSALHFGSNAIKFGGQSVLDGFRAPLPARDAADVGTVYMQLAGHAAVQSAQRLHIPIDEGNFRSSVVLFHNLLRCGSPAATLFWRELRFAAERNAQFCPGEYRVSCFVTGSSDDNPAGWRG